MGVTNNDGQPQRRAALNKSATQSDLLTSPSVTVIPSTQLPTGESKDLAADSAPDKDATGRRLRTGTHLPHSRVYALNLRLPPINPSNQTSGFASLLEFGTSTTQVAVDATRPVARMARNSHARERRPSGICGVDEHLMAERAGRLAGRQGRGLHGARVQARGGVLAHRLGRPKRRRRPQGVARG